VAANSSLEGPTSTHTSESAEHTADRTVFYQYLRPADEAGT
jgi:hypothetical protein